MLNMMVFADAERKTIRSRVREDIDISDGKRVGRPSFGYTVKNGFPQQIPSGYVRAQNFPTGSAPTERMGPKLTILP